MQTTHFPARWDGALSREAPMDSHRFGTTRMTHSTFGIRATLAQRTMTNGTISPLAASYNCPGDSRWPRFFLTVQRVHLIADRVSTYCHAEAVILDL